MRERLPYVRMGVLFTAMGVSVSGQHRWSAGGSGMTLTSEPVSTRNRPELCDFRAMAETEGMVTSMTWSATSASLLKSIKASAEARTIRTFSGKHCRNSSLRKVLA